MTLFNDYVLAEPGWLTLLIFLPLLMLLAYREGAQSWIIYPTLRVLGSLGIKPKNQLARLRPLILPLMLIPAIIAMARPQEAKSRTSRNASGIDIMIALDVSYSMSTPDFYDTTGRMRRPERRIEAAKKIITEFIKRRPDDRIGIVTFAARPYTAAPITLDHQILELKLRDIALVNSRTESGTAIGSAIIAAGERLENLDRGKETQSTQNKSKVIVLVTDGASNSGQLSPLEAAGIVSDLDIKIYPVAIGTPQGRYNGSSTGQEFDTETLKKISQKTDGDFYRALDYTGLREAFTSIDQLEKTEVKRHTRTIKKELYPYFLGTSVILIFGFLTFTSLNPPPLP